MLLTIKHGLGYTYPGCAVDAEVVVRDPGTSESGTRLSCRSKLSTSQLIAAGFLRKSVRRSGARGTAIVPAESGKGNSVGVEPLFGSAQFREVHRSGPRWSPHGAGNTDRSSATLRSLFERRDVGTESS